ncbi:MAG: hypothetical protein WB507_05840 [Solirubrobacterales bacterium]
MSRVAKRGLLVGVAMLVLLLVGRSAAEPHQSGNLIVSLQGGIAPRALPRAHPAPVAVRLQAGIRTANRVPVPRVSGIRLELAWRGALDTRGLPICPRWRLHTVNSREALAACGPALVGRGRLYDRVFIPGQAPFGLHAQLLVFNGTTARGRPAVWVHAYTTNPPVSFVLPFHIRRQSGPFPTALVSVVPHSVGPWPRFAHFQVVVGRHFSYKGRTHSYISASCPVPPRFTEAPLSFARATFNLAEGHRVWAEAVRSCKAG